MCLITDSMRAAGLREGEYVLGAKDSDHRVIVRDGVAWMPGFESICRQRQLDEPGCPDCRAALQHSAARRCENGRRKHRLKSWA